MKKVYYKFRSLHKAIQIGFLVTFCVFVLSAGWIGWWLGSPLFLPGNTANEEDVSDLIESMQETSSTTNSTGASNTSTTTQTIPRDRIVKSGDFVTFSSLHSGTGTGAIVELAEGGYSVFFLNVKIANGPDLFVYLSVKSTFETDKDSLGEHENLGRLQNNIGNFSVPIADFVDVNIYNSVLIYCLFPGMVIFTYASLQDA